MASNLDADIAWHRQQAVACADALAILARDPDRSEHAAEVRKLDEAMRRYQAKLEEMLRLQTEH